MRDVPIQIDPAAFGAASAVLGQKVAEQLSQAAASLESGMAGSAAMAGSDPCGVAWAQAYDEAARVGAGGIADLANACHQIAALLEQTGFNHSAAESASNPTGSAPDTTDYHAAPTVGAPSLPSAHSGSVSPPSGWGLVEAAVGWVWPNGDPARLRDAGRVWSTAAASLRAAAGLVPAAISSIRSQQSPEVDDAVTVCRSMQQHIDDVALGCDDLGRACGDYADHLEQAHQEIIGALEELLVWTVAIEAAGAVGSLVTFGGAEVAAQVAEAGRIAATAARIGSIISRVVELARTVGESIAAIAGRIGQVAQRLKRILGARISRATAEQVERLPAVGKEAEAAAQEKLAAAGARGTVDEAAKRFNPAERKIADRLADEGNDVTAVSEQGPGRHPGALVDGKPTEFKTMDGGGGDSANVKNILDKSARSGGQARDIIIDAEATDLTREQALAGINRFLGNKKGSYDSITIWLKDSTRLTWP